MSPNSSESCSNESWCSLWWSMGFGSLPPGGELFAFAGEKAVHLPKSEFAFALIPTAEPPNGCWGGDVEMGMGSEGIGGWVWGEVGCGAVVAWSVCGVTMR